jgi:hypothetical protein
MVSLFRGSAKFLLVWKLPAMAFLLVAKLAVTFVPFRNIIRYSGAQLVEHPVTTLPQNLTQLKKAQHARKVIYQARRSLPFEVNCFPQALLATFLLSLRKVPHTFFFGVRRNDGAFQAHAWVTCGHVTVCGDCGSSEYRIISTYTHQVGS